MTERAIIGTGIVAACLAVIGGVCLYQCGAPMDPPKLDDEQNGFGQVMPPQDGFRTFTTGEGMTIQWGGQTSMGAQPLDVVNATIARIQFEQGTDEMASDQNARAMAHLMLARQVLEGKQETTDDGTPILE